MSVIQNLVHDFGGFKLDIPHWEISDSGITSLKGRSGSGKSLIIRILLGLEECPRLVWSFHGENLAALPIEKRGLGVVFQNYELFPHLTAQENIEFAARARKIEISRRQIKLDELVENLQLKNCLYRKAKLLSGGEQQRVALARALIGRPRFLFLDEPFSALDAELKSEARALVRKIIQLEQIPTLLVSHDEDDIRDLAEHRIHIQNGELV
jgi:sulfate transport system ATP-binding protein/putative spermidine/putrescine transport system ATP-binding protein